MSAEFLQDFEAVSVTSQLEHTELQADVTSLEDIEEILKSNLRKISDMTQDEKKISDVALDENALDGYPENDEVDRDMLGMIDLQLSDLVELLEKDLTSVDAANGSTVEKAVPKSPDYFSHVTGIPKKQEMLQSSEELLEDINFIINGATDFTSSHDQISLEKEDIKLAGKDIARCHSDPKVDVNRHSVQSSKDKVHFIVSSTSVSEDISVRTDNDLQELIPFDENYNQSNKDQSADSVDFEQHHKEASDVNTSSENLKMATVSQEDSQEVPQSLSSTTENVVIEQSCFPLPDLLSETADEVTKTSSSSKLRSHLEDDITVDGEGGGNQDGDSVDLCYLSYDENLTCSFYELQLHHNENSELLEHGQRGRPPRQKVNKPAVPRRIEPVFSQAAIQSGNLHHQFLTSQLSNIRPMHTSVVPTMLQPHLGRVTQRFPVVLHGDPYSPSRLYVQVCPRTVPSHQISYADSVFSTSSSEVSTSSKDTSKKTYVSSKTEVGSERKRSDPSVEVASSHFQDDSSEITSPVNLSVEIDGPIRHKTSSLLRFSNIQTYNSHMNVNAADQGLNPVSVLAEPYRGHANLQTCSTMMASTGAQPYGYEHTPFVSSGQNLRPQYFPGSCNAMSSGLPYGQAGVQTYLNNQSSVEHSQTMQISQRFAECGTQGLPYQLPFQSDMQYNASGYIVGSSSQGPQFGHNSVEQAGNWRSDANFTNATSSESLCLGSGDPSRYVCANGTSDYARVGSPGKAAVALPDIPMDPLSRRVRMLVGIGSQGQRKEQVDHNIAVSYATHSHHNPAALSRSGPSHEELYGNMMQLSPPAELTRHEFSNEHHQRDLHRSHAHLPSGAAAIGSGIEKSQMHPKSVPSHTSSRSSKGPGIPLPVERSKTRVELWLNNNTMFRPDLDSGTYDPSDHSLIPEPSLPQTVNRSSEYARRGQTVLKNSCEIVGLFEGKRMVMVASHPNPKLKIGKRGNTQNGHLKGSNQRQMFSDASVISGSSLGSGHTESSKEKFAEGRQDSSIECQDELFVNLGDEKSSHLFTATKDLTGYDGNMEVKKVRNIPQKQLPVSNQSSLNCLVGQMDEEQKADLAIDEDVKLLEQKSLEKYLAGFSSSSGSSHVLSEVGQFLLASDVKPLSNASGNNQDSSFKLEAAIGGNSKQSSFDASKYITPSDFESWEKKKAQNGKSSWDGYLDHMKYCSSDSMSSLPNTSHHSDVKPLVNIPLNDIAEVIGQNGDLNQQLSASDDLHPLLSQSEQKQKAVKRRTLDNQDESVPQAWQGTAADISQKNQNKEIFGLPAMQTALIQSQNHRPSKNMEHMKDQLASKGGIFGDQFPTTFDGKGGISDYVVGPPDMQPRLPVQPSNRQDQFAHFQTSLPGHTSTVPQIQLGASLALNSSKTETLNRLQSFSSSDLPFDIEMASWEISKECRPSLSSELYKEMNVSHSGAVPVSSSYLNNIQDFLPSATEELTQTSQLPQPSSSSSMSSVSSASRMVNADFKKPHRVAQNSFCSNIPAATAQKTSLPYYQSVGGDSDVSMSSDNSLSNAALLHGGINMDQAERSPKQQLLQQEQLEQYQLLQQQLHLQKIIHEQIMEQRMQQKQSQQHLHPQMVNQQQQHYQQQQQLLENQQQQQHYQQQQQLLENQQQQQHQHLQNQQQQLLQNQQQHLQNQHQHQQLLKHQQQQQLQSQQHGTQNQQQQFQTYQQQLLRLQQQQQGQNQQVQQQIMQTLKVQKMQDHQQHQELMQTHQKQQHIQNHQEHQQVQKQLQQKEQQKLLLQKQSECFNTITTTTFPQASVGFQAVPRHCLTEIQPGNFTSDARSQARATVNPNNGLIGLPQPVSTLSMNESAPSMRSSVTGSSMSLGPQSSSQSMTCGSVHTITSHEVCGTNHNQAVTHSNFRETPAAMDQNFSVRMTSLQQQSSGSKLVTERDQELKSATESQLWKYLNGGFPSLDFVDFCQDSFLLSPNFPHDASSLAQNMPQLNLANASEPLVNGDRLCADVEKVQPAERSREQTDSDVSVLSINSDMDILSIQPDKDGETLLHLLCYMTTEWREKKLPSVPSFPGFLEALNLQSNNQTALHVAVKNEDLEIVTFLISHGADVNICCISSQKGTTSKATNRKQAVQQTALHEAVELGNTDIVKVLLTSKNVKVDAKRPDSGFTPLMLALQLHQQSDRHRQFNREKIILELIKNQASLSLHDTIQSMTPLMYAIQSKDVSLVEQIIQQVGPERARVLVNDRAKKDMTCLHFAAGLKLESSLKKRLLRCIIVAGGDPSAKNSEGDTPRDWDRPNINEVLHQLTSP